LKAGFTLAGSNRGHEGDASYALRHPQQVVDFPDRAAHEMAVTACGGGTVAAGGCRSARKSGHQFH